MNKIDCYSQREEREMKNREMIGFESLEEATRAEHSPATRRLTTLSLECARGKDILKAARDLELASAILYARFDAGL
tara:strand:- start:180 stop:410 length:231 start_codon:yes stop_codon:yes gene_type:complete